MLRPWTRILAFAFCLLPFIGCATTPQQGPSTTVQIQEPVTTPKDYFVWPITGEVISFFGQKIYGTQNKGIDIRARRGDAIHASKEGVVVFSSNTFKGHGNIIIVDHLDGFFTVYSRNSQNLVKGGDRVEQNQTIALAGSTGRGENPYLHFEIRRHGRPQNPLYYLP
jgi:lipoprotein NlpD